VYTLVTGGAGFIGSHLVKALINNNQKVVVLDDLSMGNINNLPKSENLVFIEGDLGNKATVQDLFKTYDFEKVFHLGAVASVAASVENPLKTHQTNLEGSLYLLEEAKKNKNLKRFVFASSAAVYGDEPTLPKTEKSPIQPLTPYAIDKFASERYALSYYQLYGTPTAAVRFFNVYGINQNPSSPYSGVISILTDRLLSNKKGSEKSFTVFGDGEQTRDFVYVDDVVRALLLVSESKDALGHVFNVGTGNPVKLMDMINIYKKISDVDLPLSYEEQRDGDIRESYADITALKSIGFAPEYTLEEGLNVYWKHECEQE
jgi:UDP-glucose 4-epimerase